MESLLADYRADRGITKNEPGLTIGGIRGDLWYDPGVLPGAGLSDGLTFGIIVAGDQTDVADVDVGLFPHLDWMYYSQYSWNVISGAAGHQFHDRLEIRAQRRLEEIQDDLFAVFSPAMTGAGQLDITLQTSVLLVLP